MGERARTLHTPPGLLTSEDVATHSAGQSPASCFMPSEPSAEPFLTKEPLGLTGLDTLTMLPAT